MTARRNARDEMDGGRRRVALGVPILLAFCMLASLAAAGGLGIWALWNQRELQGVRERATARRSELRQVERELQEEQERAALLEAEVERILAALDESGVDVPLDPATEQALDGVEREVVALRGLAPTGPVDRALMTRGRLQDYVLQEFEVDFGEGADGYALMLVAFDMIDLHLDLYDLLVRLYTEQIAGFYDPETKELYVIAGLGPVGDIELLIYAHEFTHALQDQHYDLEELGLRDDADEEYDGDHLMAIQSLVEGDATLAMQLYLLENYTAAEVLALQADLQQMDMQVYESAPAVLREALEFPYMQGMLFVQDLYMAGGWAAVDAAYADPPRSTEQILHLERYRSGDVPQVVALAPLTATLGAGWRQVDEDVLGEFLLRFYLAQQVPAAEAREAAEGWGGDRYAVHLRPVDGALVMALRTVWDTPADAEEFVDAYVAYADARYGSEGTDEGDGLCWVGEEDVLCLVFGPVDAVIVLGPDEQVVQAVLETTSSE